MSEEPKVYQYPKKGYFVIIKDGEKTKTKSFNLKHTPKNEIKIKNKIINGG